MKLTHVNFCVTAGFYLPHINDEWLDYLKDSDIIIDTSIRKCGFDSLPVKRCTFISTLRFYKYKKIYFKLEDGILEGMGIRKEIDVKGAFEWDFWYIKIKGLWHVYIAYNTNNPEDMFPILVFRKERLFDVEKAIILAPKDM